MDDIYAILDRAYESDNADEIMTLVKQALALDPDNPEALLLKADVMEDDEERLAVLEKALSSAKKMLTEEGVSAEDVADDDDGLVYMGILQRLAFTLFYLEEDERALESVRELLSYDGDEQETAKALYYRILLERREWAHALEETMGDSNHSLGWAYTRMICTFMLSKDKSTDKIDKMLWEAVRMSPNVPFYMLGYIPDPVDDTETEEEDFNFGFLFEEALSVSRELLNWFSKATILFGLLSGRFGQESKDMEEILDALDGSGDYRELTEKLPQHGTKANDTAIINALAAGRYPRTR